MQILFLVCFIFLSSNIVLAQKGELKGTIYEAGTGETIPYANIVKEGTLTGTYTSDDGFYSLQLTPGTFEIKFSSLSFLDTLITVTIKRNQVTELDVFLRPDLLLMDEIVVSADRVTRKVQELAVRRERLNAGLKSYQAEIYKLAILGSNEAQKDSANRFRATAFSERVTKVKHIIRPERFTEEIIANRASKTFSVNTISFLQEDRH